MRERARWSQRTERVDASARTRSRLVLICSLGGGLSAALLLLLALMQRMRADQMLMAQRPRPGVASLPGHQPAIVLVSFASGRNYEVSMSRLHHIAARVGFNRTVGWRRHDFLRDPVVAQHSEAVHALDMMGNGSTPHKARRPFCAAFKPLLLWRTMQQCSEGDFVMWMDASKYFDYSVRHLRVKQTHIDPPPSQS